jgi:hypothetical protein
MCIHRCITSRPSELFVILVRDVFSSFGITVTLGKPEINDVDNVLSLLLRDSDQKVIWLDVSVNEMVVM